MTLNKRMIYLRTSETMRRSLQTIARACSGDWRIRVRFGRMAATDHEVIELPAHSPEYLMMEDQGEWLLHMRANVAHEAFHVRLTSKSPFEPLIARHPALPAGVVHWVGNSLEDGRIEKAGVNIWPGAYDWLVGSNELLWRQSKATGDKAHDFRMGLVSLAVNGKDMQELSDPEVIEVLRKCEPIIERAKRARTTEDCFIYASQICRLIEPYKDWFPDDPPRQTYNGGTASPSGHGEATSAGEGERDPAAPGKAERRKAAAGNGSGTGGTKPEGAPESEPARPGAPGGGADDGSCEGKAEGTDDSVLSPPVDLSELLEAARKEAEKLAKEAAEAEKAAAAKAGEDALTEAERAKAAGELGAGFDEFPADDDPPAYESLRREVRGIIRRLEAALSPLLTKRRTEPYSADRSGLVDAGRVFRFPAVGDPRVFRQPGRETRVPDVAWYLLIDESGSMGSSTGSGGRVKFEAAREAAILFAETLKGLKQTFSVVGFTESDNVEHRRYIRWGEQKLTRLATLSHRANNRDGVSINIAARELLKRPEPIKVLFVLSDGQPAGSKPPGKTTLEEAQEATRWAGMRGIAVVGLYFGPDGELPQVRSIYPRMVHVKNLAQLPSMVARELKLAAKRAAVYG